VKIPQKRNGLLKVFTVNKVSLAVASCLRSLYSCSVDPAGNLFSLQQKKKVRRMASNSKSRNRESGTLQQHKTNPIEINIVRLCVTDDRNLNPFKFNSESTATSFISHQYSWDYRHEREQEHNQSFTKGGA